MDHFARTQRLGLAGCAVGAVLFLAGLLLLFIRATPPHLLLEDVWAVVQDTMLFGGPMLAIGSAISVAILSQAEPR